VTKKYIYSRVYCSCPSGVNQITEISRVQQDTSWSTST